MKKTMTILLLVALLAAVLPMSAFAAQTAIYRVNTKSDPLMVHGTPNDRKDTRIGRLPRNCAVTVLKKSGNWWRVKSVKGMTGWVFKKYLASGAYAKVTTKDTGLNIRKSINGKVLGSAPKGAQVTVNALSGNWANVVYNKLKGWSFRSYLTWIV